MIKRIDGIILGSLILLSIIFRGSFGFVFMACFYLSFLIYRYCYRRAKKEPRWRPLKYLLVIGYCLFFIPFLITEGILITDIVVHRNQSPHADYVIVLGAGLKGEEPRPTLRLRLERAHAYYDQHPQTIFVVSGGMGNQETITEAEAMSRSLLHYGIPASQIIKENQSTSTEENLRFSLALLEEREGKHLSECTLGVISNDFHLYRVGIIAKHLNIEVERIYAPSVWYLLPRYLTREFFAIINEYRKEWQSKLTL